MRIAVLSDIHDHLEYLQKALAAVRDAQVLICCGDFCAPFTVAAIAEQFSGPVHCIFGNNDGDPFLISQVAGRFDHVTIHGLYAELEFDNRQVAVIHYPKIARRLAQAGIFDLVCYGHDHRAHVEQIGKTVLANPGEVMGRFGSPSLGVYDTTTGEFTHMAVK
ncbi:MAG TPA: YfcE family phosphodiesterase [Anaerolineae bacterium]|nr:YfcE family phosphodiesterase [Anaerolineae bacterium]HIQ05920.1 YfcE family phosphodiesterase [Anaerolineae bacterium]